MHTGASHSVEPAFGQLGKRLVGCTVKMNTLCVFANMSPGMYDTMLIIVFLRDSTWPGLENVTSWEVYLGLHDLQMEDDQSLVQRRGVEAFVRHPGYNLC